MMSKLSDFLNDEIEERGWSKRELARRAGISSATVTDVMNERAAPGTRFCISISRALGRLPEDIMRLAGILPPLPPTVEEEREAVNMFRRLNRQARGVILVTMRSLLGAPSAPSQAIDGQLVEHNAERDDQLRTFPEWLTWHIDRSGEAMTEEEQGLVRDLVMRIWQTGEREGELSGLWR